jgi:hypothetical protein
MLILVARACWSLWEGGIFRGWEIGEEASRNREEIAADCSRRLSEGFPPCYSAQHTCGWLAVEPGPVIAA